MYLPRRPKLPQNGTETRRPRGGFHAKQAYPGTGRYQGACRLGVAIAHYLGEVLRGVTALTFAWLGTDVFFVLS